MPFNIVRSDITRVKADALVDGACARAEATPGGDKAIYEAAGAEALLALRRQVGKVGTGEAAVTPAVNLKAAFLIHTVCPMWQGGTAGEVSALESCWAHCLKLAADCGCRSLASPLLGTGECGFPKEQALTVAQDAIASFLRSYDMKVSLVVSLKGSSLLSGAAADDVHSYIKAHKAQSKGKSVYGAPSALLAPQSKGKRGKRGKAGTDELVLTGESACLGATESASFAPSARGIEEVLSRVGETFQQRLFCLIGERGMSEVEVYTKANLDRRVFSKIRCNPRYQPKKKTALALAVALQLDLDETKDLIARAGFALSPSSKADLIIEYFISRKNYNIFDINLALFDYDQPILGE